MNVSCAPHSCMPYTPAPTCMAMQIMVYKCESALKMNFMRNGIKGLDSLCCLSSIEVNYLVGFHFRDHV